MKFPRSYMSNCMGAWFFRWGLPPHTLIMNRLPSEHQGRCRSLSAGVAFTFRHTTGKSSQKRKGRDLQTLPTLLDIGYLPLFYIAAYLYCRIPIFPYCHIGVFLYSCIYAYMAIQTYIYTDCLADLIVVHPFPSPTMARLAAFFGHCLWDFRSFP